MILRPINTRVSRSAPAQKRSGAAAQRLRLNLHVNRLNVEGLAPSEQGVFLSALRARLNILAQDAARHGLTPKLAANGDAVHRRVDGGLLPARIDAKSMAERAAAAILRELLR